MLKSLSVFAMLLGLGFFAVGCEPADTTTEPATDTATDAGTDTTAEPATDAETAP